jgi:uncharacterized membrane protein
VAGGDAHRPGGSREGRAVAMTGRADSQPSTNPLDVQAVLELRARQEEQVGRHQRIVERITKALGRPLTIYVTLAAVAAWVVCNLVAVALSAPAPDPPPFAYLQGVVGLAALLMTTMVLTTQNRQARHAEQRSHIDLQVNLVAEKKVAKLIALIEELRRDLPGVPNRKDSVADAMSNSVDPRAAIAALQSSIDAPPSGCDEPRGPAKGPAR